AVLEPPTPIFDRSSRSLPAPVLMLTLPAVLAEAEPMAFMPETLTASLPEPVLTTTAPPTEVAPETDRRLLPLLRLIDKFPPMLLDAAELSASETSSLPPAAVRTRSVAIA